MRRFAFVALAVAIVLAAGCKSKKSGRQDLAAGNQVAPRVVRLYFESPDMLLVAESRNVQLPQNAPAALPGLTRELLKGSANPSVPRLFPADTVLRGAFLLPDGTAFIDLGGATLSQGWATGSHQELMAVYSIVQTVTANFPEAKRVRLLLNGVPAETLGGHIAIDRALTPNAAVVDQRLR